MARRFVEQTERPFFHLSDPLVIKGKDNTKAGTHHAQAKQEQPSLDVQSWMKPFKKAHVLHPPYASSPS